MNPITRVFVELSVGLCLFALMAMTAGVLHTLADARLDAKPKCWFGKAGLFTSFCLGIVVFLQMVWSLGVVFLTSARAFWEL